jgi:hypothetical protein
MICELVNQLEAVGIGFILRNDQVKVTLPEGLEDDMLLKLKQLKGRKSELMTYLESKENDDLAKRSGFIVGISGELYTLTCFENSKGLSSMAFIERIGDHWQAWRETFKKGECRALWVKSISHAHNFTTALKRATRELAYFKRV